MAIFSAAAQAASTPAAPASDAIAIAVIFDTSGSMSQRIATKGGAMDTKARIAQRSFDNVIARLEAFSRGAAGKPLFVGVYAFVGNNAIVAKRLGPFDAAALRQWSATARFTAGTPLGDAMFLAGRDLIAAPVGARHMLVLTDGENTAGRTPAAALEQVNLAASQKQRAVFTHVIALDIKPAVFNALKQQGATLIGAANEEQLNEKFDFILEEKILVEAPR